MNGWLPSDAPPAPAAVVVLQVVETAQPVGHLPAQRRQPLGRRQLQLGERAGHDEVGDEARQRLLGAAVGEAGEPIGGAEQRPGHRRRQRDAHGAGRRVGGGRHLPATASSRRCRPAIRWRDLALHPVGQHRQGELERRRRSVPVAAVAVNTARPGRRGGVAPGVAALAVGVDGAGDRRRGAASRSRRSAGTCDAGLAARRRRSCGRWSASRPSSPSVRNRGVTSRTIRSLVVVVRATPTPTRVSVVTARAVSRHVVSESG